MEEKQYRIAELQKETKRAYSRMGFALFFMFGSALLFQTIISTEVSLLCPELFETGWYLWALSVLPLYLIGFPVSLIFFMREDPVRKPGQKLSFGTWLGILTICIFWLYAGNLLGSLVSSFFSFFRNEETQNIVNQITSNSDIWSNLAATVLIAPLMEELVTRKLVIDRARRFGDARACIFSGLMFGLMHGNFQQFFYAFFLGLIFAWVYVKTGRVIYTVLLHASINFLGGFLPTLIQKGVDVDTLTWENVSDIGKFIENLSGDMIIYIIYELSVLTLALIGLIVTVFFGKQLVPKKQEKGTQFHRTTWMYLNPGVICFLLYSATVFFLSLLM